MTPRRQDEAFVPLRDFQVPDRLVGIRMVVNDIVTEHTDYRPAGVDCDANADGALMQVRLAARTPSGQADHRHHRVTPIDEHPDVRHALERDRAEERIRPDAVLDHRAVARPDEAVLAADDI